MRALHAWRAYNNTLRAERHKRHSGTGLRLGFASWTRHLLRLIEHTDQWEYARCSGHFNISMLTSLDSWGEDSLAEPANVVDVLHVEPGPDSEMRRILGVREPPLRIGVIRGITPSQLRRLVRRQVSKKRDILDISPAGWNCTICRLTPMKATRPCDIGEDDWSRGVWTVYVA